MSIMGIARRFYKRGKKRGGIRWHGMEEEPVCGRYYLVAYIIDWQKFPIHYAVRYCWADGIMPYYGQTNIAWAEIDAPKFNIVL